MKHIYTDLAMKACISMQRSFVPKVEHRTVDIFRLLVMILLNLCYQTELGIIYHLRKIMHNVVPNFLEIIFLS